jgi:transposase
LSPQRIIFLVVVMEDAMGKLLVPDELWALIEPILPKYPHVPGVGKPRIDDRVCLTGIIFVLKTGIPWEDFPQEMGCCGMTLWNRLDEWRRAGVWEQLHRLLLDKLRGANQIDFSRVIVDSSSVRAVHGGKKQAPAPSTAEKQAPNTIWLSMPAGFLWPTS